MSVTPPFEPGAVLNIVPGWNSDSAHVFLGDYVTVHGGIYRGRVYKCHWSCPESRQWLAGQELLGSIPLQWAEARWVSVLCDMGGAIVVPDRPEFIVRVEPFPIANRDIDLYFRAEES